MEEIVRRLNAEYRFNLSEEEIKVIATQAEEAHRLFQRLYEVERIR
jgi:Asp-tRNA(Asn)/Glu-tRNA(Gln) amidotransferase C subunit